LREGHIDYLVNRAIKLGILPVQAIQMASLNAAIHFRVAHLVGSLTPGRWADVVLADSLERITASHVFFKGQLVAQGGKLIGSAPPAEYPEWIKHTVIVRRGKQAADFMLRADGPTADVRVIELYPDQIINKVGQATLPVVDGNVAPDVAQDALKIAVVERHGKNGNIGIAFVRGFGLQQGALASSVAHDHHNIIVAGTNEADMAACVRAIESIQGGLAVAAGGEVLGQLALPIGGLLSDQPVSEVIAGLEKITAIARRLGCKLPAPFMTISFISLPTVPELGLTDMGLVSVRDHAIISPFAE
jgi:adenine deaminase